MIIDFDQPIMNMRGIPLRRPGDPPKDAVRLGNQWVAPDKKPIDVPPVPITLGFLVVEALLARSEKGLTGQNKAERFSLALKLNMGGKVELKTESIALIKKLIGDDGFEMSSPLIVGRAYELLEGKNNAADPTDK